MGEDEKGREEREEGGGAPHLFTGVIHEDDFLHQLPRGPVQDGVNLGGSG